MSIEEIARHHHDPKKDAPSKKRLSPSHNVNADLNFLTIDDIIYRVMWNDGLREVPAQDYEGRYKEPYGKKAFGGKTVLVRAGIDAPVGPAGRLAGTERIRCAIPTLEELSGYGARVVVLGHQGRAGKSSFIELDQHTRVIRRLINRSSRTKRTVKYLGNLSQNQVISKKIRSLKDGEILVLNNIRFLVDEVFVRDKPGLRPHELNEGSRFVSILEPLVDFYVNDAFNTSHRKHASMIGFTKILNLVGRHTEKEMKENKEVLNIIEYPFVPIFGGVKVGDYMGLISNSVLSEKVPYVLLGGIPGIIGRLSKDVKGRGHYHFGKATEAFLEKNVSKALGRFFQDLFRLPEGRKKLVLPRDFLVKDDSNILNLTSEEIDSHPQKDRFQLWGIGEKTTKYFVSRTLKAKTIYKKGPVSKSEEPGFDGPERRILEAVMKAKKLGAYTISSGGDSIEIAKKLGYDEQALFSRLSDAGGAFVHVLEGNRIAWPMLQLNTHWNFFYRRPLRSGLPAKYSLKSRYRLALTVPRDGLPEALRYEPPR
jgi:phosphoglycerate kinase